MISVFTNLFLYLFISLFMYMYACGGMGTLVYCSQRPEEGAKFSGMGVAGYCELSSLDGRN